MNPEKLLSSYIRKSRPYLNRFFKEELAVAAAVSPIVAQTVKSFWSFMGGKNLRGALTYYSYQMFGGRSQVDILKASLAVEMTHAFLLMHDDVMDRDDLRRGQPTIHRQYESKFRQSFAGDRKGDRQHFGLSLAITTGDLGPYFSNLILERTDFRPKVKTLLLKEFSRTIVNTAYGQALDIFYEADSKLTLDKILKVHQLKTAQYTISGPLKYGAILAGVSPTSAVFRALENYGLPVGVAFQLRDDELGMFSSRKELGKPVDSDLREGKNTILFQRVFEKGTREQVKFLRKVHGHRRLKPEDVVKVRRIIVDSGVLRYSQMMARQLVAKGKKFIPAITQDKYFQDLLSTAADYVIERKN